MNMISRWFAGVVALTGVIPGQAQRPCQPGPARWLEVPDAAYSCAWTGEWARALDLDSDGLADFSHERFRAVAHYGDPIWDPNRPPLDPVEYYHQDDTIEAYYPAGHVEMYWRVWRPANDQPELRLPPGHELLPEPLMSVPPPYGSWGLPEPARSYVYPTFEAIGVGIILRDTRYTCELAPRLCGENGFVGYLAPWFETPVGLMREDFDYYFGFRVQRPDGWHLGWMHLRWPYERGGQTPDPVELVAWAVHPEPDTAIVVGEPARPTLRYERPAAGGLVVRWSAVWADAVLERSPSLTAPDWVPVSGSESHAAHLPATEAPGFFRLRVP